MSAYDDIIGNYDIIGARSDYNGAFNQPGGPVPNWGPVPGWGPNIGPMGLAFGQEGDQGMPPGGGDMIARPEGHPAMPYPPPPGPGYWGGWGPGPLGWGPGGWPPGVVPNGNAVASFLSAKEGLLVAPRGPTRARREWLGFDRTCIGPCEVVTLTTSPQILCKPYRLLIPSDIAFQLLILDVVFGKWRLFANGGSMPAAAVIETAEDNDFNPDTVQPGCNVTLVLQNTSNEKVDFRGGFWAKCVE